MSVVGRLCWRETGAVDGGLLMLRRVASSRNAGGVQHALIRDAGRHLDRGRRIAVVLKILHLGLLLLLLLRRRAETRTNHVGTVVLLLLLRHEARLWHCCDWVACKFSARLVVREEKRVTYLLRESRMLGAPS